MSSGMISPTDDYLIHQIESVLCKSGSGQAEWSEHAFAFLISPRPADPLIESLLWIHPNINTGFLHAYILALHGDRQFNLRGCRPIVDRKATDLGPLKNSVVLPLQRWQVSLEPNEHVDFSVSANCVATVEAQEWPQMRYEDAGVPYRVQQPMLQLGIVESGTASLGEETWNLKDWYFVRDHCWGYRSARVPGMHTWLPAFCGDATVVLWYAESISHEPLYNFGQLFLPDGETRNLREITVEYDEPGQTKFEWTFIDATGQNHTLRGVKASDFGMQHRAGWSGELPDDYYGPFRVEGDTWKLAEIGPPPQGRAALMHYPMWYELDGEPGTGVLAHYSPRPVQ